MEEGGCRAKARVDKNNELVQLIFELKFYYLETRSLDYFVF